MTLSWHDPADWHTAPLVIGTHQVVTPVPAELHELGRTHGQRVIRARYDLWLQHPSGGDELADLRRLITTHYRVRWAPVRNLRLVRLAAAPGHATAEQVRGRVDLYGGLCWMCGDVAEGIDHVKPLARGGSLWPANLRPACRSCNSRKSATWPYPPAFAGRRAA